MIIDNDDQGKYMSYIETKYMQSYSMAAKIKTFILCYLQLDKLPQNKVVASGVDSFCCR